MCISVLPLSTMCTMYFCGGQVRRGYQIPCNWSCVLLWTIKEVLGTECRSFGRAESVLNHWVIPILISMGLFLKQSLSQNLKIIHSGKIAGQWSPGNLLSRLPSTEITGVHSPLYVVFFFSGYWGSELGSSWCVRKMDCPSLIIQDLNMMWFG